jgi:hypothetical protein
MNALLNATSHVNGVRPVNGRGLAHLKLTDDDLVRLAADMATGTRPFQPSVAQTALLTGVPVAAIRQEIKARAAQHENGQGIRAFVESWEHLSEEARQEAFRLIGPGEIWDTLSSVIV